MYSVSLERIPLPELSTYTLFSTLSLITSLIHVFLVHQTGISTPSRAPPIVLHNHTTILKSGPNELCPIPISSEECFYDVFFRIAYALYADSWCFWSLLNMAYCALVLVGKSLQSGLFGELREEEENHIRDKFWNFVFYRVIFLYGVLNIQTPLESMLWTSWSTVLGFLHLLTHLCKDRTELFMQAPEERDAAWGKNSSASSSQCRQWRIILLLIGIFCFGLLLAGASVLVGVVFSWHRTCFMLAEVMQLHVVTGYVLLRYALHLRYSRSSVTSNNGKRVSSEQPVAPEECPLEDQQLSHAYRMLSASIDLCHHVHMLLWSSVRLNVTTLVILLHLQYLYQEMRTTWRRYQEFERVVCLLQRGPLVQGAPGSVCAICWDVLGCHRMLPCGHGFHRTCLLRWIPHSSTCPVCRTALAGDESTREGCTTHEGTVAVDSNDLPDSSLGNSISAAPPNMDGESNREEEQPSSVMNERPSSSKYARHMLEDSDPDNSGDGHDENRGNGILRSSAAEYEDALLLLEDAVVGQRTRRGLRPSLTTSELLTGHLQVDLTFPTDEFLRSSSSSNLLDFK